jgi:putative spermidine/putrescine transport system substrate-binding protein
MKFESWEDLWKPEMKAKLASPDFDPSHIIAISAILAGSDAAHWEKGQDKLKALKPNFKAFYTNDANSQQLLASGETPVQVVLSMNAYYMISQGVPITLAIPKEGAVLGVDTVAIMKGSKKADLAYKFINTLYDPEVQAEIAKIKKGSPAVLNAKIDPEIAKLPGVFTTAAQWKQQINIDAKMRAEKTAEWRKWFAENIMN